MGSTQNRELVRDTYITLGSIAWEYITLGIFTTEYITLGISTREVCILNITLRTLPCKVQYLKVNI